MQSNAEMSESEKNYFRQIVRENLLKRDLQEKREMNKELKEEIDGVEATLLGTASKLAEVMPCEKAVDKYPDLYEALYVIRKVKEACVHTYGAGRESKTQSKIDRA